VNSADLKTVAALQKLLGDLQRQISNPEPTESAPTLPLDTRLGTCETHGSFVDQLIEIRVAVGRKSEPIPYWLGCPECRKDWERLNLEDKERLEKLQIAADPVPRSSRNVNPHEQMGRNTDPYHDNLPAFNHGCGAYRR
jgi:hypothetical protein